MGVLANLGLTLFGVVLLAAGVVNINSVFMLVGLVFAATGVVLMFFKEED